MNRLIKLVRVARGERMSAFACMTKALDDYLRGFCEHGRDARYGECHEKECYRCEHGTSFFEDCDQCHLQRRAEAAAHAEYGRVRWPADEQLRRISDQSREMHR